MSTSQTTPSAAATPSVAATPPTQNTIRPALVVVDDQDATRTTIGGALERRYGIDYDVVVADSAETGQSELRRLHDAGVDVAIIAANAHLDDDCTTFLAATRDAFPRARRLVLAALGDNWVLPSIAHAAALGEVDVFDYLPTSDRDERFLSGIASILVDWAQEIGRGDPRITIVGAKGDRDFGILVGVLQRWETQPIRKLLAGTPEADAFLAQLGIDGPMPVVALNDGQFVAGANMATLSDAIGSGANSGPDPHATSFDVVVLGLGPAGFSAAVNAASEGLKTLLVNETYSQASSSPLVRNYLGFPGGITGAELMRRAWTQSMMFGASTRIGRLATDIRRVDGRNVVQLEDGAEISARVVMLAIGADYRRLEVESVDRLVGRGVFYGYGALEAQAMTGVDAAVIGGANSAVQAAISVSRYARSVTLIVRGSTLRESASEYLITQIEDRPNVTVRYDSEVVHASDERRLRSITVRNMQTGATETRHVSGLFVMIGAMPRTDWLPSTIARDERGYVLTGVDVPQDDDPEHPRLPFETSMPGVFALGDVRAGSVKRIAAAVGEGSAAVAQVHRYLARFATDGATDGVASVPVLEPGAAASTIR
jgi:thioredoxin reductase (NADPH)